MVDCTSCRYANDDSAKFCKGCGSALGASAAVGLNELPVKTVAWWKSKWSIALVSVLSAGCGGAYWYYGAVEQPAFAPMEASWRAAHEPAELAQELCMLMNFDGSPIPIHSDKLLAEAPKDPKAITALPASIKVNAHGKTYLRGSIRAEGFADSYGDWIAVKRSSNDTSLLDMSNGVFSLPDENEMLFIDPTGEIQILPVQQSMNATSFSSHGVAGVQTKNVTTGEQKWGIIDRSGAFIVPPRFANFVMINSDIAFAYEGGRWAKIDVASFAKNPVATTFSFELESLSPLPNRSLIAVKKNGKWDIINEVGKSVMAASSPAYDIIYPSFSKHHFAAMVSGKWGVYDLNGATIFAPNFDRALILLPEGSAAFALTPVGRELDEEQVNWLNRQGKILRTEKLRLKGLYTSPKPILIARDWTHRKKGYEKGYEYVVLDDKGLVLTNPKSTDGLKAAQDFTNHCTMGPSGEGFDS